MTEPNTGKIHTEYTRVQNNARFSAGVQTGAEAQPTARRGVAPRLKKE
jgi:hypothetical protein